MLGEREAGGSILVVHPQDGSSPSTAARRRRQTAKGNGQPAVAFGHHEEVHLPPVREEHRSSHHFDSESIEAGSRHSSADRRNSSSHMSLSSSLTSQASSVSRLSFQDRGKQESGHVSLRGTRSSLHKSVNTRYARLKALSRSLVDNPRFTALTAVLTIYALFGDDFRLATTRKNADIFFNILTVLCILVFIVEVVASSLGQKDYVLGFFFWLDVISTATLLVDLTWISDAVLCRDMGQSSALKTSRAGRVGARASRTMRILRLMRMVKLYKTYRSQTTRNSTVAVEGDAPPGVDAQDSLAFLNDTEDQEEVALDENGRRSVLHNHPSNGSVPSDGLEQGAPMPEMRVGRKLSDMTTRRVIVIVLVMLFVQPQFRLSQHGREDFAVSGKYAAESVFKRFRDWCKFQAPGSFLAGRPWCLRAFEGLPSAAVRLYAQERRYLEDQLLAYILGHHHDPLFAWRLFWVGLSSAELGRDAAAQNLLGQLGQFNQTSLLGNLTFTPADFAARLTKSGESAADEIPGSVRQRLMNPWRERCKNQMVGVNLHYENLVDEKTARALECSIDDELRCSEVVYITPDAMTGAEEDFLTVWFVFDTRAFSTPEALLSLFQTLFICVVVGLGALSFTKDANELLLDPIERMMAKIAVIKENPLAAIRLGDMEYTNDERQREKERAKLARMGRVWKAIYLYKIKMFRQKEPMETVMLERTIIKLGRLLALGFGEAGAAIVANSVVSTTYGLRESDPGQPVDVLIGYCRIRHFVDALEVLENKVTLFVNQVCEVVHGCIDDFFGAPIRNKGDAFLVIWRLASFPSDRHSKLADMAVMSSVKILTEINRSRMLALWRYHPGLRQRHKNFRADLGFGLHRGWAIEGTIGSECKIDASYLSPHVSVAPRLEAATEHFGVHVLVSEPLIKACGAEMLARSRVIDRVSIRGLKQALRIYTIDLDFSKVEVKWQPPEKVVRNPFKVRQLREMRKKEKWADDHRIAGDFETDQDLVIMRAKYSRQFFKRFGMAFRNYEVGEWMAARDMFLTCHYTPKMDIGKIMVTGKADWPEDGPTVALLSFMSRAHFVPPSGWPGHRELP